MTECFKQEKMSTGEFFTFDFIIHSTMIDEFKVLIH